MTKLNNPIFFLIGLLTFFLSSCHNKEGNPEISLLPNQKVTKILDLGNLSGSLDSIYHFQIDLYNPSDETLVIKRVDVSCSCVKIADKPKFISTKEKTTLHGSLSVKEGSSFDKNIYILYDSIGTALIKIKGEIIPNK